MEKIKPHKERRLKEIEVLKAAILKAARDLAIEDGWPKVSIRKIAAIIAYTPPVIYEHFKNKEAILIELESHGFRKLKYALEEARESQSDPVEQLLAISSTFWDWAFKNAEYYQVMFNLDGIRSTPPSTEALKDTGKSVAEVLKQIHLFSADTDELFFNWWAMMHGHVSLVMSGQLRGMDSQVKRHMLGGMKRFAKAL
ncbi:MAG: TetR/AcrR family transcriptional regulator [Bacteroidota bacterium]